MFGQRSNNDDKSGAPAIPPAGTLNTSTGIPDDQAVSQMLSDNDAPRLTPPPNAFMPFGGQAPVPQPAAPTAAFSGAVPQPLSTPVLEGSSSIEMSTEDLVRMKHDALQHLQPLVGTLQQNPEEEFRTLMMMIQATDDKSMLKKALDAAKKIQDDKIRAQAMLDVINEINYFTQVNEQ